MTVKIAVPGLAGYSRHTGIGRVLYGLLDALGDNTDLYEAQYVRWRVPVLRNFARGLAGVPHDADVVLFPQLTGVGALSRKSNFNSAVILLDMGILDSNEDRQSTNILSRLVIKRDIRHLSYARHIIAISSFTRDRLVAFMPELAPKVSVIPLGLSPVFSAHRKSKADCRRSLERIVRAPLGGPLLLYVGSERRRKNVPFLLDVLNLLKTKYPDMALLKVGAPGSALERQRLLNRLQSLNLRVNKDVYFVQDLNDEELADAYKAADGFVSASLYEGFGLPYIESLSVGTDVVAVKTGILSNDMPGVTLVTPNVAEFAEAVDRVLCHPMTVDMEAKIRSYARRHFSWDQFARRWMEVVMSGSDSSRPASLQAITKGLRTR